MARVVASPHELNRSKQELVCDLLGQAARLGLVEACRRIWGTLNDTESAMVELLLEHGATVDQSHFEGLDDDYDHESALEEDPRLVDMAMIKETLQVL